MSGSNNAPPNTNYKWFGSVLGSELLKAFDAGFTGEMTPGIDGFHWDVAGGRGVFSNHWSSCCTDGYIWGAMPNGKYVVDARLKTFEAGIDTFAVATDARGVAADACPKVTFSASPSASKVEVDLAETSANFQSTINNGLTGQCTNIDVSGRDVTDLKPGNICAQPQQRLGSAKSIFYKVHFEFYEPLGCSYRIVARGETFSFAKGGGGAVMLIDGTPAVQAFGSIAGGELELKNIGVSPGRHSVTIYAVGGDYATTASAGISLRYDRKCGGEGLVPATRNNFLKSSQYPWACDTSGVSGDVHFAYGKIFEQVGNKGFEKRFSIHQDEIDECGVCGGDGTTCSTECKLSEWSQWSTCDPNRGYKAFRSRAVLIPPSKPAQNPCDPLAEEEQCQDCVVGEWTPWTACSQGKKFRSRDVLKEPSARGIPCPLLNETADCDYTTDVCYSACSIVSNAAAAPSEIFPIGRWPKVHPFVNPPLVAQLPPSCTEPDAGGLISHTMCNASSNIDVSELFVNEKDGKSQSGIRKLLKEKFPHGLDDILLCRRR